MKKTFWFNTGVKPGMNAPYGCQQWRNGTIQIPVICENVPENAIFKFGCYQNNLPESEKPNWIVREILNAEEKGGLQSKYAYFQIPA